MKTQGKPQVGFEIANNPPRTAAPRKANAEEAKAPVKTAPSRSGQDRAGAIAARNQEVRATHSGPSLDGQAEARLQNVLQQMAKLDVPEAKADQLSEGLRMMERALGITLTETVEKPAARARPAVMNFGAGCPVLEGTAEERKHHLGGKGANLQEMSSLNLPIPPGFTISTEVCADYMKRPELSSEVRAQVADALKEMENKLGKKFGDPSAPLLVSVRSGAAASMPGMMDTILNLGLNDQVVAGLAKATGDARFAYDAYRRFIGMFANVVMGVDYRHFEEALEKTKHRFGVKDDTELSASQLKDLVSDYKAIVTRHAPKPFPESPKEQLQDAIGAVFNSWNSDRAEQYRSINKIHGLIGTAVNVQSMVFGNTGPESGTGVCFTRDPATGEQKIYGEFLVNAQGEDVVAGIRTPMPISEMPKVFPEAYAQLVAYCAQLEKHYGDMQDIEFTIENNKLFILQTRNGKRTGEAAVKVAVDLVEAEAMSARTAVLKRVTPEDIDQILRPRFDDSGDGPVKVVTQGIAASPGAAVGRAVFTVKDAIEMAKQGEKVILIRNDTSPEDVGGMDAAQAVLTRLGGKTSHAAVVARGWGKPCVTGAGDITVDEIAKRLTTDSGTVVNHGDWLSLNGSTGEVVLGKRNLVTPEPSGELATFMKWVDELLSKEVRVNAASVKDVQKGQTLGSAGVGMFRAEHLCFAGEGLKHTQRMILARTTEDREAALAEQHEAWKQEFKKLFMAQQEGPVTIRLLSATMDKFLPDSDLRLRKVAADAGVPFEVAKAKREELKSADPTLGLKGCRLGIQYPEITAAQTRAILAAAEEVRKEGHRVVPEILVPMVGTAAEFEHQKQVIEKVARPSKIKVGANIETPRAALIAGELAKKAGFLSFDTDALTELTYGVTRTAAAPLVESYQKQGMEQQDPFTRFDKKGVGELIKLAAAQARESVADVSLRLSGHSSDPRALTFAVKAGLDGVSAAAKEIPRAKLAAVQAEHS